MDFRRLSNRAKDLVEKRGGSDSLKADAEELKKIAKGRGSVGEKAKAAAAAIKDPGKRATQSGGGEAPVAEAATPPERARAEEKVESEARGKHAGGAGRGDGGAV